MLLEVFISYAHQDQPFRNELDKHLSNLKRQGIISSWSDSDIAPGTEWRRQVMSHLDTAQIILLLISADFMASDFCYSIEMTRALERHRVNEARVLPIILRPTDWKDAPFAALDVLPADGKAVTRWPTLDDAFENVIQGIRRAIQQMADRQARAASIDRIGQRFGDYWLRSRLGGGGFGNVYLGEHMHSHELAAVKVLHVHLTRSEELRAFINEVRTFRLQHPHIVRLLDVGIAPDETPFLVMEYASNGTLRDRHPTGSRVPLSTVLTYVAPIASALQYAHNLHLVHRDIKPENILLGTAGELWLSDFGIATAARSTGSLTTEGMGGTLPYMAPEQILGRPRAQSDQYSLAIVVYEWLTGNWPFRGTPIEIAMQHQMALPRALRTQVPTIPLEVEQVVLAALSKDPKDRFGNIQAFATALAYAAQPLSERRVSSEISQRASSAMEHPRNEVIVETTGGEQPQITASDVMEPQVRDAFYSSMKAAPVSKGISGSFPLADPEQLPNSSALSAPIQPVAKEAKVWVYGKRQVVTTLILAFFFGIVSYIVLSLIYQEIYYVTPDFIIWEYGFLLPLPIFFASFFGPWVGTGATGIGFFLAYFIKALGPLPKGYQFLPSPFWVGAILMFSALLTGFLLLKINGQYSHFRNILFAWLMGLLNVCLAKVFITLIYAVPDGYLFVPFYIFDLLPLILPTVVLLPILLLASNAIRSVWARRSI